jgi:putative hydroxymethylpyrimidine transport system substrate-binding protein
MRAGTLINTPMNTLLSYDAIRADEVYLVNVNFQLTSALMTGQVDAVIGGYLNIEALEMKLAGKAPVVLNVEDYAVPACDELIIVANRNEAHSEKIKKFLRTLKRGNAELQAHPEESWQAFARAHT